MRVVLQRSLAASVSCNERVVGSISKGYVLLIGFAPGDSEAIVEKVANKILGLRINADTDGKMNLALDKEKDAILAISQFTLYANIKKGKRPSFAHSMDPTDAKNLYTHFCSYIDNEGYQIEQGIFGADMQVELINNGPVTICIDSDEL